MDQEHGKKGEEHKIGVNWSLHLQTDKFEYVIKQGRAWFCLFVQQF